MNNFMVYLLRHVFSIIVAFFEHSEYSAFWCAPPDKHPASQKTGQGRLTPWLQDASLTADNDKQDGAEKDEYFHGVPASVTWLW